MLHPFFFLFFFFENSNFFLILLLSGELFAQCRYDPASNTVEPVTDSSRYFVIKVENEKGQSLLSFHSFDFF